MKIGRKFSTMSLKEYFLYIDNRKKYTDFNTLGLYRSIIENERLSIEEKIELREYAHALFGKSFEFLQLKDPYTFIAVSTLGQTLTVVEERQLWKTVRLNQQQILKKKNIRHRSFGIYSKHCCGYDTCPLDGIMIKPGTYLYEIQMHFHTDRNKPGKWEKTGRTLRERRQKGKLIDQGMSEA